MMRSALTEKGKHYLDGKTISSKHALLDILVDYYSFGMLVNIVITGSVVTADSPLSLVVDHSTVSSVVYRVIERVNVGSLKFLRLNLFRMYVFLVVNRDTRALIARIN